MNFLAVQSDLVFHLRGRRTQQRLADRLGLDRNRIYKLESGKANLEWKIFLKLCEVASISPETVLRRSIGFHGDPTDTVSLVKHLMGKRLQDDLARDLSVSRSMISRWVNGKIEPNLVQILKLIYFCTMDFLEFIGLLVGEVELPSLKEELRKARAYYECVDKYPWLSILLSAMDLAEYKKTATVEFLSKKTKLNPIQLNAVIGDLHNADLIAWNGKCWETRINRVLIRGPMETRKKWTRFALSQALQSVDYGYDPPLMKFSSKIFSMNQKTFEKFYEKYIEFFHEMGQLIDEGQAGADKLYVMATAILDFDHIKELS